MKLIRAFRFLFCLTVLSHHAFAQSNTGVPGLYFSGGYISNHIVIQCAGLDMDTTLGMERYAKHINILEIKGISDVHIPYLKRELTKLAAIENSISVIQTTGLYFELPKFEKLSILRLNCHVGRYWQLIPDSVESRNHRNWQPSSALENLRTLEIAVRPGEHDDAIGFLLDDLGDLSNLRTLHIGDAIQPATLHRIAKLPELQELSFVPDHITGDWPTFTSGQLRNLNLPSDEPISFASAICEMESLEHLYINPPLEYTCLLSLPNLKELYITVVEPYLRGGAFLKLLTRKSRKAFESSLSEWESVAEQMVDLDFRIHRRPHQSTKKSDTRWTVGFPILTKSQGVGGPSQECSKLMQLPITHPISWTEYSHIASVDQVPASPALLKTLRLNGTQISNMEDCFDLGLFITCEYMEFRNFDEAQREQIESGLKRLANRPNQLKRLVVDHNLDIPEQFDLDQLERVQSIDSTTGPIQWQNGLKTLRMTIEPGARLPKFSGTLNQLKTISIVDKAELSEAEWQRLADQLQGLELQRCDLERSSSSTFPVAWSRINAPTLVLHGPSLESFENWTQIATPYWRSTYEVYIHSDSLRRLPRTLSKGQMSYLQLYTPNLDSIEQTFSPPRLKYLMIHQSQFMVFPKTLCALDSLKRLEISIHDLKAKPACNPRSTALEYVQIIESPADPTDMYLSYKRKKGLARRWKRWLGADFVSVSAIKD